MNSITMQVPDERLLKLQETANNLGISIEELVLIGIEEILDKPNASFKGAMNYVLKKNTEFYKRLA
ncbi:DNA-binding protein [Nostoc sp. C052]|uniref:DNA-binding protein n=1 Tax=Nostoc sp. C052 TaxID=2576902 RepID=UPI0015C2F8DF|nr:DNA-binding protein [Nostoc sp. C052]QLE44244.1 DNA-binding protein [Nostoc sp. C052]